MTIEIQDHDVTVLLGHAREQLATLDAGSVQCIVTSPPLWTELGPRAARCLVCGLVAPLRYSGGPWNGDIGIVRHRPARDLLQVRCDLHGWRQLTATTDGTLMCRCGELPR